jgi:8-oxo-dGTP diphosphatase
MKKLSAGGVVFDGQGRVALVRQRDRKRRMRWTLPKGKLDPGETLVAAARREVHEETGLRVRVGHRLGIHESRRRRTHYFAMRVVRDDRVFCAETIERRFVHPRVARRLLRSRRDRLMLKLALRELAAARGRLTA